MRFLIPFDGRFRSLLQITGQQGTLLSRKVLCMVWGAAQGTVPSETTSTCFKSLKVSLAQPSLCNLGPHQGCARGIPWAVAVPGQTQPAGRSLLLSHHPFCRSRSNAERKGSNLDASQKLKFSLGRRKQQQCQAWSDAFCSRKMGLRELSKEKKNYLQHKYQ